jgi:hypothetical protein
MTYFQRDTNKYCLILDEQFDGSSLDTSVWTREVNMGGYGNGQFDWTTDSETNSFVEDGTLYLVPTLTSDSLGVDAVTNGAVVNLTATGTCTGTSLWNNTNCINELGTGYAFAGTSNPITCSTLTDIADCVAVSNATTGTMLRPAQSARLMTNFSSNAVLRFGRVEIKAKMPTGDWLWPAIWMMPKDSVYGEWPMSGEIDIVETKGNAPGSRLDEASNSVRSTLHWGAAPGSKTDQYKKTTKSVSMARDWYNKDFTTFGLEWTPKYLKTWQHTRARGLFGTVFNQGFWQKGGLSKVSDVGTTNPWLTSNMTNVAPFDQEFYLILSVAVGGTNGYFPDGENKPWANSGENPALDFWNARNTWYPTWPTDHKERGMAVEYVKMWRIAEKGETPGQGNCKA